MKNRKKKRTFLWIISPILLLGAIFLLVSEFGPFFFGMIILFLGLTGLIILNITSSKHYNWPLIMVFILLLGILFKKMHWPFAGVLLTIGTFFLCVTSLINIVRIQIQASENSFFRWFGSASYVIISVYMAGFISHIQHWSAEVGDILGYTGIVLFVFTILGMVFTLPGSNYLAWSDFEKKTFFRSILIPLGIVFGLILVTMVFSDVFIWLIGSSRPLNLSELDILFNTEGLEVLLI